MKTHFNSPRLILVLGLLLATAVPGKCFYNPNTGRWLSRDSNEEQGGLNLYAFASNEDLQSIDPLGHSRLVLASVKAPKATSNCGGAEATVTFRMDGAQGLTGWLIQHVKGDYRVTDCSGRPVKGHYGTFQYWEAWHVIDGVVYVDPLDKGGVDVMIEDGDDLFGLPDQGSGTQGTMRKEGYIDFYEGYKLTIPPWTHFPSAGALPAIRTPPFKWSDSGKLPHWLASSWRCCCPDYRKTMVDGFPWY